MAAAALLSMSFQHVVAVISAKELKRRARQGDAAAGKLYKAAAYGSSLRALLWLFTGLLLAGFFVWAANTLPLWAALAASVGLIWFGFVWLAGGRVSTISQKIAAIWAPVLSWTLHYLHPLIDGATGIARRLRQLHIHTGLYEKSDLVELIDQQLSQTDSRIESDELNIAKSALVFGDKLVSDVTTPRRMVKTVSVKENLGPLLMDELHKSGHSRFPAYEDKEDNIVGTLYLHDLVNHQSGGTVGELIKKQVLYVHEDQTLYDALQAILKTHQHLFVVINSFEEYVGIITIEDVLEQIVGQPIVDEFDQYEDLRAVAQQTAAKEHTNQARQEAPSITEEKPPKPQPEVDDTIEV